MILWAPTDNALVVSVAFRAAFSITVPSTSAASPPGGTERKTTGPVGMLSPGGTALTVAVNVTACPALAGLADDVSIVVVFVVPLVMNWLIGDDVLPPKLLFSS